MKVLSLIISLCIVACGYSNNPDSNSVSSDRLSSENKKSTYQQGREDSSYVSVDSVLRQAGVFDYVLLFHSDDKINEIYRVENQDNSIELKKKYSVNNKKQKYICFEVADLPTGITWNILYNQKSSSFFITDKYDMEALGDTLDRNSVNFTSKTATIVSDVNKNSYQVKLKQIWPK